MATITNETPAAEAARIVWETSEGVQLRMDEITDAQLLEISQQLSTRIGANESLIMEGVINPNADGSIDPATLATIDENLHLISKLAEMTIETRRRTQDPAPIVWITNAGQEMRMDQITDDHLMAIRTFLQDSIGYANNVILADPEASTAMEALGNIQFMSAKWAEMTDEAGKRGLLTASPSTDADGMSI